MNRGAFIIIWLFFTVFAYGQVGINTTDPDPAAILDIQSEDKGVLIPRVDIENLDDINPITGGSPVGLLVYNTNTSIGEGFYYWTGTQWSTVDGGRNWGLQGNTGTVAANNFIGTSDNIDLRFRTNNFERFTITTGTTQANGGRLLAHADGAAGLPIYSWNADSNMGMYRIGTDILGFSTNGVERLRIDENGYVGIRNDVLENMFHMTNGGINVGANAMANFENLGEEGVTLSGYNKSTNNGYNAIEGITDYNGNSYAPSGVFGLAISTVLTHRAIGVRGAANGRDGIGVMGSIQYSQGGYGWAGYFAGDVFSSGGFWVPSDHRFKKDIKPFTNAIKTIQKLNVVSYNFDIEKFPNAGFSPEREFGFIAQELKEILPNVVTEKYIVTNSTTELSQNSKTDLTFQKFYVVDYTKMIPIAIEAIQEQQEIIESQEARIAKLEMMVQELMNKK